VRGRRRIRPPARADASTDRHPVPGRDHRLPDPHRDGPVNAEAAARKAWTNFFDPGTSVKDKAAPARDWPRARRLLRPNRHIGHARPGHFNEILLRAHSALDIAEIVRRLQEEGHTIDPEDLAHISPYLTGPIRRFGENPPTNSALSRRRTTRG
jgi:hypothetical protein